MHELLILVKIMRKGQKWKKQKETLGMQVSVLYILILKYNARFGIKFALIDYQYIILPDTEI